MGEILRIAANVGTPLSLLGVAIALAFFAYNRHLKHAEKKLELLPQEQRAKAVDTYLTRYGIDGVNLTREQKVRLIRDETDKRYRITRLYLIIAAVVFVACVVLAVLAFLLVPSTPSTGGLPKATSLVLRMEKEGEQIVNEQASGKGTGALFEFTLSNPTSGLAIVDSASVEVLDVMEDKWATTQALVSTYKYEVTLDPDKRGGSCLSPRISSTRLGRLIASL